MSEQDYTPGLTLTSNDRLRLASTFHGLTAIATQIAPLKNSQGIDYVHTEPQRVGVEAPCEP